MKNATAHPPAEKRRRFRRLRAALSEAPLLSWIFGALVAALLEQFIGMPVAYLVGLSRVPVLFGCMIIFASPWLIPSAAVYVFLIYVLPVTGIARMSRKPFNRLAAWLLRYPIWVSVGVHLVAFYLALSVWANINDYRLLTVKLTLIAVIVTLSLNVINGYLGEFSCSHPGFMALGAYAASIFTVGLFVNDRVFGKAVLAAGLGPWLFPVALVLGGLVAAVSALAVAIPSFKTRGDYLAIISLAFMFIVKSLIENLEFVGGPRGLSSQPDYAGLLTVFGWTVLCVWTINNFVRSTMGKALNAIRDDETAAEAMTVDTRKAKMTAFLFAAFWAGVGGGLFAHVLRYVNPATFALQKLAEVLAMVYFGGLNSVYGSVVGAVSLSLLGEVLRPLELYKWIIIPLLLIFVMIFRPTGLIAFREFDVRKLVTPRQ